MQFRKSEQEKARHLSTDHANSERWGKSTTITTTTFSPRFRFQIRPAQIKLQAYRKAFMERNLKIQPAAV
jgi:hypothetical protein